MIDPRRVAFIIGNGTTRQEFDLNKLSSQTTFGCNALYRDFYPSFLVAIDDEIIKEIKHSPFPPDRFIIPPYDEQFEPAQCNPHRPRSNAGMNAMLEAIKRGYTRLYCLGFDFFIANPNQMTSNVYDGTNAYGPETRASFVDSLNRINYLQFIVDAAPSVEFIFCFPNKTLQFHQVLAIHKNVFGMRFDAVEKRLFNIDGYNLTCQL